MTDILNDSILKSYDGDQEGAHRVEMRDGQAVVTQDRRESFEDSERADIARKGTAEFQVTRNGRVMPQGAALDDKCMIKLPDGDGGYIETTLANAVSVGIMFKNNAGQYVWDQEHVEAEMAPEEQEQVQQPAGEFLEDKGAENLVNIIARDVSPMSTISVINGLIEEGEVNPNLLGSVASELGVTPNEAAGYLNKMTGAFQAQADGVIERVTGGLVEASVLYDWARNNDPEALKEAMRTQITQRNTSGYKALAATYMKGLDKHNPQIVMDAAHAAGLSPRWDSSSKAIVLNFPDGRSFSYRQALELGLINLSAVK